MTDDPLRKAFAENTTAPELVRLADRLADLRVRLDEIRDVQKDAQKDYDAAEAQLFDALENAGLMQIRTPRGLFSTNDLVWASVIDEDSARLWADKHLPELLTLNRQRLSKVVRETLAGDREGPLPEGVSWTASRKINWRRS